MKWMQWRREVNTRYANMDWLQVKFVFCHGLALLPPIHQRPLLLWQLWPQSTPNGLQIRSKFGYAQVFKPLNCHFIASPNTPNKYLRFWPNFSPKSSIGSGWFWNALDLFCVKHLLAARLSDLPSHEYLTPLISHEWFHEWFGNRRMPAHAQGAWNNFPCRSATFAKPAGCQEAVLSHFADKVQRRHRWQRSRVAA